MPGYYFYSKSEGILYAEATEVDRPKRINAYDVLVIDENGAIVAKFNGIVYRKKKKFPG